MTQQALVQPMPSQQATLPAQIETLVRKIVYRAMVQPLPRVTAQVRNNFFVFDARTIARFYAANKYVCFMHDDEEFILDDSLASLEHRFQMHGFIKAHRGDLVNLNHVRCARRNGRSIVLELTDGQNVQVSRRLCGNVLRRLQVAFRASMTPAQTLGLANADMVEIEPVR